MAKDLPISPLAPTSFPDLPPVAGVMAATGRLGLYKHERDDVMVVSFPKGTNVAGALTLSSTASVDVLWCRAGLKSGHEGRALVVNAGNSNAFTGAAGLAKNAATVAAMTAALGLADEEIYLSATGVIGQPVRADLIAEQVPTLVGALAAPDFHGLAQTIATTDTFPKGAGAKISIDGQDDIAIAGIAKGSGMIAPNMATMLVYIFTDAAISQPLLQEMVSAHVDVTFNAITVDSDTSTSDTLLVFATGAAGGPEISDAADPRASLFSQALKDVMLDLALQVVHDGEGATKAIRIDVEGAEDNVSAKKIGMAIANSPLVKTAIAGEDANWGRVVMAIGKSGEPVDIAQIGVKFGPIWIAQDGGPVPYDEKVVDAHVEGQHIEIVAKVGSGNGVARVYTCDLTHGYISINGDYRT